MTFCKKCFDMGFKYNFRISFPSLPKSAKAKLKMTDLSLQIHLSMKKSMTSTTSYGRQRASPRTKNAKAFLFVDFCNGINGRPGPSHT